MRLSSALLIACIVVSVSGCQRYDRPAETRAHDDADTAARQAGRGAYKASREAGKLAVEAGRELKQKAHEAHEGWKDAKRESRDRGK